jgi:guanylate kinase
MLDKNNNRANSGKRLIVLSGPSCVGKTPLLKALKRDARVKFVSPILYTSRKPRPGEKDGIDFHFRDEKEIRSFSETQFVVGPVRHLYQAIDLKELEGLIGEHDTIVLEIYPVLANILLDNSQFKKMAKAIRLVRVFISPIDEKELEDICAKMSFPGPEKALATIMAQKQINRARNQGKIIGLDEMRDIELRASKAFEEIKMGRFYDHVLVNHDNEDSDHWKYHPPLGEAGKTLSRFISILRG